MVLCELFAASFVKLQKPLNEGGGAALLFYRTGLRLHSCCRYSNNREEGNWAHQKIATQAPQLKSEHLTCLLQLRSLGAVRCWAREPVHQSALTHVHVLKECRAVWSNSSQLQFRAVCVIMTLCVAVVLEESTYHYKRTRSTSKTHLNGMTGPWARHLQQVLSAGNSRLWVMFTKSQCEGPPYLRWAESQRSGIVLWLFGIYLVIRPLKSNGGMKALALLNLLLLAYFV